MEIRQLFFYYWYRIWDLPFTIIGITQRNHKKETFVSLWNDFLKNLPLYAARVVAVVRSFKKSQIFLRSLIHVKQLRDGTKVVLNRIKIRIHIFNFSSRMRFLRAHITWARRRFLTTRRIILVWCVHFSLFYVKISFKKSKF